MKHLFHIFAHGAQWKYEGARWIDYVMFKEILVKGGVMLDEDIPDYQIDLIFDKYTLSNGKPNKK